MSSAGDHLDTWEVERLETIERAARELVDAMEAGHPDHRLVYAGLVAQLRYALGIRGPAAGTTCRCPFPRNLCPGCGQDCAACAAAAGST